MEKMITIQKDGITKHVPVNILSEYLQLGWKRQEEINRNFNFPKSK